MSLFCSVSDGHNHDGHTKLGLWIITGMLSFLIIEKIFAKEGEFDHVSSSQNSR